MKATRFESVLFAFLLLVAAFPARTFASFRHAGIASRPAIIVVAYGAPEELEIQVEISKSEETILVSAARATRVWELDFRLYREDVFRTTAFRGNDKDFAGTVLLCRSGGEERRVPIPQDCLTPGGRQDVMTLDCENWSLSAGVPDWRGAAVVAQRLGLILAARALFFLLMKYKTARSWLSFLGVSLLTQFPLNLILKNQMAADDFVLHSKVFVGALFVVSVVILLVEAMLMALLVNEHDRDHTTAYVVGANVLGGMALVAALLLLPV